MTSRASSTDWNSLTDISGEAGALAAHQTEGEWGGEGCHGRKLMQRRSRLAISREFSAEDLYGVRLPGSVDALADIGVETRSGIVCDLEFSFNIDKKLFLVCVELGLDGTKKFITAVPQHVLNCFAQVFLTSPLGGSMEIVSAFVL